MQSSELEDYLEVRMPDRENLHVTQFVEITDGWETEIYSFDIESGEGDKTSIERLVLRLYAGPWAKYKARKEFGLLNRLFQAGYPVPEVTLIEEDSTPLGRPFIVMERIDGNQMWTLMESEEDNSKLFLQFSTLYHDLHSLDWHLLVENPEEFQELDSKKAVSQWIQKYEERTKEIGRTELLAIVDWLQGEIENVGFEELSATHNDFHPNNILIDAAGNPFVIDWTAADLMDYRVDLAWTLLLTKIYAGESMGEAFLRGYEEVSQKTVEDIHFFEVVGALRRLTDILVSLDVNSEDIGLRDGAADMIREQLTQNMTLLDIVKDHTGLELSEIRKIMDRK